MKKFIVALGVVVALALASGSSQAAAVLTLRDLVTSTTVTVIDDGAGDVLNTTPGAITFAGSVGSNWWINVSTGLTKPVSGSATAPSMDLNSTDVSKGAGQLEITLSDDGFLNPSLGEIGLSLYFGGTAIGDISYEAFVNATSLDVLSFSNPSLPSTYAFSGTGYGSASAGSPYSLSQIVTITHFGAGASSFDAALVPEPGTMVLLGSGLIGLAGWSRKKFRQ